MYLISTFNIRRVLCLALLVRLLFFLNSPLALEPDGLTWVNSDENTYYSIAQIYKKGFLSGISDEKAIWAAPLNPIYIFLITKLFSKGILAVRLLNIVISVLTIYIVYLIGRKKSEKIGIGAALILAIYQPLVELSAMIMTEVPFIFLLTLGLYCYTNYQEYRRLQWLVAASFLLGLATLTRSILLLFPVMILVGKGFLLLFQRKRDYFKEICVMFFIVGFVVGPIMIKNYYYFDKMTISTGTGAALYLGSRADTQGDEPPYYGKKYDTQRVTGEFTHLDIEGDQLLMVAAIKNIKDNPYQYAYWGIKKIGRLVIGNSFYWFYPFQNVYEYMWKFGFLKGFIRLSSLLISCFVGITGIYGVISSIKKRKPNILVYFSLYLLVMSLPFLVNYRYGIPLFVILTVIGLESISNTGMLAKPKQHFLASTMLLFIIVSGALEPIPSIYNNYFGGPINIKEIDLSRTYHKNITQESVEPNKIVGVITSSDPQIIIDCENPLNLYYISFRAEPSQEVQIFYEIDNGGFREQNSIKIKDYKGEKIQFPFYRLPLGVTRIRIDPMETAKRVSLKDVRIGAKYADF